MNSKAIQGRRSQIVRLIHSGLISNTRVTPLVDSIIRVDHAGELGADRIYAGQMAVLGNTKVGPVIQHMWEQEKVHKETFEKLIVKYRARPTLMVPIWNVAGFLLGAGTALMGEKAAMACTVAVESVIVEHYNDQLRMLIDEPEKNRELLETIQKFRDDEQEHHDSGLDHGAEQAPFYKGLTEVIKLGCKTAIAISKDLFSNRRVNNMISRSYSTSAIPKEDGQTREKWDLFGSICLERKALITRELTEFEKNYLQLLSVMEYEKSFKSDHERKKEEDKRRMETLKADTILSQSELDLLSKQTAQEHEDGWNEELKAFKPASRRTEADEKNDLKSLRRKLDRNMFLLVQCDKVKDWIMPETVLRPGETMRMTAERALRETCGDSLKVIFMSNAPCGFYKVKYPKSLKLPNIGAKIFFFKAIYHSGEIARDEKNKPDYQWASYSELENLITRKKYLNRLKMFLVDDSE